MKINKQYIQHEIVFKIPIDRNIGTLLLFSLTPSETHPLTVEEQQTDPEEPEEREPETSYHYHSMYSDDDDFDYKKEYYEDERYYYEHARDDIFDYEYVD